MSCYPATYEETVQAIMDDDADEGLREAILWLARDKDAENRELADQLREWEERDGRGPSANGTS